VVEVGGETLGWPKVRPTCFDGDVVAAALGLDAGAGREADEALEERGLAVDGCSIY
jgi:hypothetical protein